MADQSVRVVSDAKVQVAFDLMKHISGYNPEAEKVKDRAYWLTLYRQCYKAANGCSLEDILQEK